MLLLYLSEIELSTNRVESGIGIVGGNQIPFAHYIDQLIALRRSNSNLFMQHMNRAQVSILQNNKLNALGWDRARISNVLNVLTSIRSRSDIPLEEYNRAQLVAYYAMDEGGQKPSRVMATLRLYQAIQNSELDSNERIIRIKNALRDGAYLNMGVEGDTNGILHLAIALKDTTLIKLLIEQGANPNQREKYNFHLIHTAAAFGNRSILDYVYSSLFKANSNLLEILNGRGFTPLLVAAKFRNTDTIKYLLQRGADSSKVDKYNQDALHIFFQGYFGNGGFSGYQSLAHLDTVKQLLESIDYKNNELALRESLFLSSQTDALTFHYLLQEYLSTFQVEESDALELRDHLGRSLLTVSLNRKCPESFETQSVPRWLMKNNPYLVQEGPLENPETPLYTAIDHHCMHDIVMLVEEFQVVIRSKDLTKADQEQNQEIFLYLLEQLYERVKNRDVLAIAFTKKLFTYEEIGSYSLQMREGKDYIKLDKKFKNILHSLQSHENTN
ncbi:MAG: ankyrin repeat domain-containing protein [Bdellovibrionales bacterium]|nr:ankyrin repeat domain-containing protein [Bdellovibrionales bacterium]